MGIGTRVKHSLNRLYEIYRKYRFESVARNQMKMLHGTVPKLTQQQKQDIQDYWKKYGLKVPMVWHELLYYQTGAQLPSFIPESTFIQDILPYIRNASFVNGWGDKSYLDYYIRGVETVENVLRNVSGRYLDKNFRLVSAEEAQRILDEAGSKLVVKPTTDTNTGKGVQLLHAPYDLKELEKKYKGNFVFQTPICQHEEMSKFNSSSVNTIRVNSVLLDTEAHVMSAFVKVGQTGEFADNRGHERFFIGINQDGTYCDYAIDHDLNKYESIPSGYAFAGQPVYHYHEVCEAVERAHKCLPHFGMAFWDVCIREDGKPAIVEVNLRHPNATVAQAAIGDTFFGSYTDEVLRYVDEKRQIGR